MKRPDIVLIHPPSVFEFRERPIFYGPLSDVIPSSPIFEMYPIGFLTLAAFLRKHGYRVRIVNLALLMMRSRSFDPEKLLRSLNPKLFGIDLHWLPHVQGAMRVASILKQLHPRTPVVMGGISATYFHEEIVRRRVVDFVIRGSVAEASLLALVREIDAPHDFSRVPNLTWRKGSEIHVNRASYIPTSVDEFDYDLGMMVADVVRRFDFWTTIPFHTFWRHPITAVFTVRGCKRACITCGASAPAFDRFMKLHQPILRGPDAIARQVSDLASITRAPIFLVGDIRDGGASYARDVLAALARARVANRIVFEFFDPPSDEFIAEIASSVEHWGAELSPESHDESIRARLGKARFTNERFERAIASILAHGGEHLDLFYMIGLPGQTVASVLQTTDAIEELFQRFDARLSAFIAPMGPFIDPGSDGFERADAMGYRLHARTLAEHEALLEQRDWESMLNYETLWMSREQIVDATYAAATRLNELKVHYGRIPEKKASRVRARLAEARLLRQRLDTLNERAIDPATHATLLAQIRKFSQGTINDKTELFEPRAFLRNFRLPGIARLLVREFLRALSERRAVQPQRTSLARLPHRGS